MRASPMSNTQKQGIVSILSSGDGDGATKSTASLRRTLSADMSSKKWLSMKKIASSDQIFQEEQQSKKFDIWTSIVSPNCKVDESEDDTCPRSAPYVHPLVKKSASSLSHKSLEVCTESLGSETGSDGFSSYSSSDTEASDDGQEGHQQEQHVPDCADVQVVKYNFSPAAAGKKLPPPSFPPPLPSLTDRRMMPRRENGRLVLEAISVSAQSNFKAERQDGRLVLTLKTPEQAVEDEELSEKSREYETVKLPRLAVRACGTQKFNEQPAVPRPVTIKLSQAAVNGFDYCWRAKPTAAQAMEKNNINKHVISWIFANNYNQGLVVIEEKNLNHSVLSSKGCKEHRRAIFWEPYCIATSY